jgi:hypothetical protein
VQPCRPGAGGRFTVPFFGLVIEERLTTYRLGRFSSVPRADVLLFLEAQRVRLDQRLPYSSYRAMSPTLFMSAASYRPRLQP